MSKPKPWNNPALLLRISQALTWARIQVALMFIVFAVFSKLYVLAVFAVFVVVGPWLLDWRAKILADRLTEELLTGPRPRFGSVVRASGEVIPVVFYPTPTNPTIFTTHRVDDESVVEPVPGDVLNIDQVVPGQTVILGEPPE